MTYRFMRIVDDTLGTFLCWVLGRLLQLKEMLLPARRDVDKVRVKHILIQKYFGMGSILHAVPLIKVLRKNYPNARISFITLNSYRDLIALCNLADETLLMDFSSLPAFLKSFLRILSRVLTTRFDISVDLEYFAKFPMLISALSLANIRVGLYQRKIRPEGILTHKVYFNNYRHLSKIYLAYAGPLDLEVKAEFYDPVLPSLRQELEQTLRTRFQLNNTAEIIVVNVNAGDLFAFRKWPGHYFVELLVALLERHPDYHYLLIGSPQESEYVGGIISQVGARGNLLNCAGRTTLRELFALIEMAELVITNDSGPLHIASYYGKNIVSFFGPETPVVYGPVNKNAVVFYLEHQYCSPCMCVYDSKQSLYSETCEKNTCLLAIKPKEVLDKIEAVFLKEPEAKIP